MSRYHQRESLDLLEKFNDAHFQSHAAHEELVARMANYELAFRMQMEVPDLIDIEKEDGKTKKLYGIDEDATDAFGPEMSVGTPTR